MLSTKILSPGQRDLLIHVGVSLSQYDAITINLIPFTLPDQIDRVIFSSQNAVESFKKHSPNTRIAECYCVGHKTAQKIEEIGLTVSKTAKNAIELADFIQKTHKNDTFYFLTGSQRRDAIPAIDETTKNSIIEVKTYQNEPNYTKIDGFFDGIMFFSPNGVLSFTTENTIGNSEAICIGETTAETVASYTKNIHIANSTTIESVIAKTVKILNKND